jgi:type IV secretory pathway TraG/TraD family ATPase VirD4
MIDLSREEEAVRKKTKTQRWSSRVTRESNALDLEPNVFTREPKAIARSLKRSAEKSTRRKSSPYRSAMSMLTFYMNRAGRNLTAEDRSRLTEAKDHLRRLYHR